MLTSQNFLIEFWTNWRFFLYSRFNFIFPFFFCDAIWYAKKEVVSRTDIRGYALGFVGQFDSQIIVFTAFWSYLSAGFKQNILCYFHKFWLFGKKTTWSIQLPNDKTIDRNGYVSDYYLRKQTKE